MQEMRVESYNEIRWEQIKAIDGHPLDYLLSKGIPVYYKIHRGLFVACKHRFVPMKSSAARKMFSFEEQDKLLEVYGTDEELVCLCLDEEDLREIRATGSRGLVEFSLGGLAIRKRKDGGSTDPDTGLIEKGFHRCYLVNRRRWKEALALTSVHFIPQLEDYAEPVWVGYGDLHLVASDVEQLRTARPGKVREPYPFETEDRKLSGAIFWLFQAAISHNRDVEMAKPEIRTWLGTNVPNDLFKARWVRTAINYVPLSYRFTKNSDEEVLGSLPMGKKLKESFGGIVGLDLLIVMAIAEWNMDQSIENDPKTNKFEVASKLDDFGFDGVEVQDLTGMILGEAIDDKDWKEVATLLEQKRKRQELSFAIEKAHVGSLTHQEEDDSEQRVNAGDDDQPYLPKTLTPRL